MAHGLQGEDSSCAGGEEGEGRAYIAAHWRRGDRAFALEMGFGGRLQTIINRPTRFAAFIKQQALRLNVRGAAEIIRCAVTDTRLTLCARCRTWSS